MPENWEVLLIRAGLARSSLTLMAELVRRADAEGEILASQADLAESCAFTTRHIQRLLRGLRSSGFVASILGGSRLIMSSGRQKMSAGRQKMSSPRQILSGAIENKGQFYRPYKEERARVGGGGGNKNKKVKTPPPPSTTEIDLLITELRRWQPDLERHVAQQVMSRLRAVAPTITGEEATALVKAKAKSSQTCRSVVAVVINWSREYFTAEDLDDYRKGKSKLDFERAERMRLEAERLAADEMERQRWESVVPKQNDNVVQPIGHGPDWRDLVKTYLTQWFTGNPTEQRVKFHLFPDELQTHQVRQFLIAVGGNREDWMQQGKAGSG